MACLVVRSSFRLHDNAVLTRALADSTLCTVCIPIDSARVLSPSLCLPSVKPPYSALADPKFILGQTSHRHAWGYHQYAFLLLAVRSFVRDVRAHIRSLNRADIRVKVYKGTVSTLVTHIVRGHHSIYIDRVNDPAWEAFDNALEKAVGKRGQRSSAKTSTPTPVLHWVTTQTLLDWHDDQECCDFLKTWRNTWRISASNQAFKDYVVGRLHGTTGKKVPMPNRVQSPKATESTQADVVVRTRRCARVRAPTNERRRTTTRRARSAPPRLGGDHGTHTTATKGTYTPALLNIHSEWVRWSEAMTKAHLRPYNIVTEGLESYALNHLEATTKAMADPQWEKRLTNVSLGLRDHASTGVKDTSKLSPFFALGVLSPRWAYVQWMGTSLQARKANERVPSSAIAQLLWRETFHAASRLPLWWTQRSRNIGRSQRFWRHELCEGQPYGGWRVWRSDDPDPLYRGWLTATTGAADLDESLVLLAVDGWVHHLRRHLIADYLTRGIVKADWMIGEQWFRQTLVDHDACINRGNWMWLSASDFSTAQMRRHYGYKDYVNRHAYKERVNPLPSDTSALSITNSDGTQRRTGGGKKRTPFAPDANAKGVYGGYPDPRKRYAGHYKVPSVPPPATATVYKRVASRPHRDPTTLRFHFDDYTQFDPDCAPYEVLAMGAFGGTYFRDIWSGVRKEVVSGEAAIKALPAKWWKDVDTETYLRSPIYNRGVNYFNATCGGSLDMWESSGWINPIDPYGWFQWYCHFFEGRRTSDDTRQISRWEKFTNPRGRFVKPLMKKCQAAKTSLNDATVSPVTRQNLLHWGRLRLCPAPSLN